MRLIETTMVVPSPCCHKFANKPSMRRTVKVFRPVSVYRKYFTTIIFKSIIFLAGERATEEGNNHTSRSLSRSEIKMLPHCKTVKTGLGPLTLYSPVSLSLSHSGITYALTHCLPRPMTQWRPIESNTYKHSDRERERERGLERIPGLKPNHLCLIGWWIALLVTFLWNTPKDNLNTHQKSEQQKISEEEAEVILHISNKKCTPYKVTPPSPSYTCALLLTQKTDCLSCSATKKVFQVRKTILEEFWNLVCQSAE